MELSALWIPVVVSAVVVFVASFLAWMVLPHHKADIKTLPEEQALVDLLERLKPAPGTYMWPGCRSGESMNSDAYKARYAAGPWGSINVQAKQPNFGMNLTLTFAFYIVLSVAVAFVTAQAVERDAEFLAVFKVTAVVAILGYCAGQIPGALFMGKPTRFVMTDLADGVVYGLLTAMIFAATWPAGS